MREDDEEVEKTETTVIVSFIAAVTILGLAMVFTCYGTPERLCLTHTKSVECLEGKR